MTTYVGGASADATTVSFPAGTAAGDLAVVVAGRTSATGPSIPAGWTDLGVTSGGSGGSVHGQRGGWKVLDASDITAGNVGTWTNANQIVVGVYRPASGATPAVGANSATGGSGTDVTLPARSGLASTSWQVGLATHRGSGTPNTLKSRTATNYTARSSGFTSNTCWLGDSNATTTGIAQQTLSSTTASSGWVGRTLEVTETANNVTATPGVLNATTSTFAPQLQHAINAASPTALTLATFAPVIKLQVTPGVASLTLAAFQAAATVTAHQTAVPATAGLSVTPLAPTVTASNHQTVVPSTAALAATVYAPSVVATTNLVVAPDTAALALTTFAPAANITADRVAIPDTAALAVTPLAPMVTASDHQLATPGVANVSTASFAPVVTASDHKLVTPSTTSLSTAAFAPTITASDHKVVTPTPAELIAQAFAPTATASDHRLALPDTAALALTTFAPDASLRTITVIEEDPFWLARFGRAG